MITYRICVDYEKEKYHPGLGQEPMVNSKKNAM